MDPSPPPGPEEQPPPAGGGGDDEGTTAPAPDRGDEASELRWTVAADRVDCVGEAPMRCLRVREPDGDWELFYDAIEGFTHEEGTEYDLRVRVTRVDDPPADGSSRRVELVEIVAQRAASGSTTCTSRADCGEGQTCAGPEGCDVAWTCQPDRPCTRDLVVYCGCDGTVLRGSGSCPPAPYRNRGPCAE